MPDEHDTVGLIGLGQMGGAMCRTLLRAGRRVIAWNISPAAVDAAVAAGADRATDPADVATRARIIITSLPDARAVRAAALGTRGLVQGSGSDRLLIDTSTTSPAEARNLAAAVDAFGVGFIDAPVSGGVGGAETGRLAVMVGGTAAQFQRALPILSTIGRVVVHCGPVGAGQITKACNQLVVMATHESVAEAMLLAKASGLDPWRVREAMLAGYDSGHANLPVGGHGLPR